MRSSVLNEGIRKITPNLRFVLRDKAHASRRVTSRPWEKDPALKDVLVHMCTGRGSIAKLIHNSQEIRRIFEEFVQSADSAVISAVRNMRAAGHRFESHAKPLGRTCLFLHSCVKTAVRISAARSDMSSKLAKAWLTWLTEERALLAAMLADAADSSLQLTRLMDCEDLDPAVLSKEIHLYLMSIRSLFRDGQCINVFGYTSAMLQTLQRPVVYHVGTQMLSLGDSAGVSSEVKTRCLQRMAAWVRLAEAALSAEFPCFELAQAGPWVFIVSDTDEDFIEVLLCIGDGMNHLRFLQNTDPNPG
jgi:hypothetical protein